MNIKRVLIRTAVVLLGLGTLFVVAAYFSLRSMGFFRAPEYDQLAPEIPDLERPAILVLHKTNGFIHKEGIPAARAMLERIAAENGWSIFQTDNAAVVDSDILARFDAMIWNNTTGDILTAPQKKVFETWLTSGGSWLGLHAAGGDREYSWDWYRDSLIGAQFIGHTMSPQFQDAEVLVADPSNMTKHLPSPWLVKQEEWYGFDRNPRKTGSSILLALDETSYDTSETFFKETSMPGEHPIAWTHNVGDGLIIYTGIGHQAATYKIPEYQEFVEQALTTLIAH